MEIDFPEAPLSDLQKQADELLNGIRDVDENIKRVTGRNFYEIRRGFNQRGNRGRIARDRLPRIETSLHSESHKNHEPIHPPAEIIEAPAVLSQVVPPATLELVQPEESEVKVDEETCKRSKRMFGHLLGTLKKFKIESETSKDLSLKRQEIEKKHEERAAKEHEEAVRQKKELLQIRVEKQKSLRHLRKQIWIKELEEKSEDYFEFLSNHILLNLETPIFYTPAKHNDITLKKLDDTKEIMMKRKEDYIKLIPTFSALTEDLPKEAPDNDEDNRHSSSSESSSNEEDETEENTATQAEKLVPVENEV